MTWRLLPQSLGKPPAEVCHKDRTSIIIDEYGRNANSELWIGSESHRVCGQGRKRATLLAVAVRQGEGRASPCGIPSHRILVGV